MKKVFLSLALLLGVVSGWAQQLAPPASLPALRMGKLPSGLTYYIYPTEYTPGEVHLYLVQNVGGVVERDQEQGMAHFMEHLSFNSSDHFPSGIMNYLLSRGIKTFDAKTGINETNYQINSIPTNNPAQVDSALLILRDWVEGIRITPETVEKERGIVLEEWRQRAGVDRRLTDAIAPALYPNSPYAHRNTIGQEGTLRAFTPKGLAAFREAWYRPELQAIMIIGDIKPADYEARLRKLFRSKASKKPVSRPDIEIKTNEQPTYYRFVDADNMGASFGIYQRIAADPRDKSRNYVAENLYYQMLEGVLSVRSARLRNEGREEFIAQTISASPLVRSYDQIAWDVVPYPGKELAALKQALALREQLRRDGLTPEEFDAEQTKMLEGVKGILEQKDLDIPDNLMGLFKTHYLYGTPLKSVREEMEATYEMLTELELSDVNEWLKQTLSDRNLAFITYSSRPDEMNISLADFERTLSEVKSEPVLRFAEPRRITQLIDFPIASGRIVKERAITELGAKEWTLSNGGRMLYKYVPELKGQFYFVASSHGGRSAVQPEDLPAFIAMRPLIMRSGLGAYNRNDIHEWLKGKDINLSISIENYNEGLAGNAPTVQASNFFEYVYMVLMRQNFAPIDLDKHRELQKYLYTTRMATPRGAVDEEIKSVLYPYSELNPKQDVAFYDGIKHTDVVRIFGERLLSAADFTYCIMGDLGEGEARKLTERYIASLPKGTLSGKETYHALDFSAPDKQIARTFEADLEGDVGEVEVSYTFDGKLSEREQLALPVLESFLQARLFEELRERDQAVYSVGVNVQYEDEPKASARLSLRFSTERAKVGRTKERTYELLGEVARGAIDPLAFKQNLVQHAIGQDDVATTPEENPLMWLLYLNAYVETGKTPQQGNATNKSEIKVEDLKRGDLSALATKLMGGKHREIVVKSKAKATDRLH